MLIGQHLWEQAIISDMIHRTVSSEKEIVTYPVSYNTLYDMLVSTAALHGNKTAIVTNQPYTYSQLLTLVDAFSLVLSRTYCITPNQQVATVLYNTIEHCISLLALNKLGAVIIPLSTKSTAKELSAIIAQSDICLFLYESTIHDIIAPFSDSINGISSVDILPFCQKVTSNPDFTDINSSNSVGSYTDMAAVLFTSGTTAQSKGVILKNYNLLHAIISYQRILDLSFKDNLLLPIPLFYVTGLIAVFGLSIFIGSTLYLHKFFNPQHVLETIKTHHISFLHASPTVFSKLLEYACEFPSLPSLRSFACGSSNMPKEKLLRIHQWLPELVFHTIYGLTETSSPATIFPNDAATSPFIGSSGLPIPGVIIKIITTAGIEAAAFETGEIFICGSVVLDSYYQLDTALLKDGWLATGDIGYFNEQGYLFIVDRKKDMINRGGEKIWSFEVENALYQMPAIKESAVFGISDEMYGELPVAAIVVNPSYHLNASDIHTFLLTRISKYKIPVKYLFVDEIPLTRNSKVDKIALRKRFIHQL